MGFLDRVKEIASDGLEKGQELAKGQQLKLEIKKLEAQLEDAYAAYGRKAFEASAAGTLSADALGAEAQAIRDAKAAVDAKQAEITALGEDAETEVPAATT
jgi:hypothetical protein